MVYLYRIRNSGGKNVFTILKLVFGEVLNLIMVKSYISRGVGSTEAMGVTDGEDRNRQGQCPQLCIQRLQRCMKAGRRPGPDQPAKPGARPLVCSKNLEIVSYLFVGLRPCLEFQKNKASFSSL
jgi:hypothetical protein